jgi:hypothetical protein
MANHYYPPLGRCIYCGVTELPPSIYRFGNEHIIPLSMGGNLVLQEASCKKCERIINKEVETPITSHEWGYFRANRGFPTRNNKNRGSNKKDRKMYIELRTLDGNPLKIPISDYSAPVFLYKFGEARILYGVSEGNDHLRWTVDVLTDHDAEMRMQQKFPNWDKKHTLKTRPHEFARLLAKIAYGYSVAELGFGTFDVFVKDIIIGQSNDYFNFVGGSYDILPPIPGGDHITNISFKFTSSKKALVIVDIRLLSQTSTPNYHVVVGEIDLENPEHLKSFDQHRINGKLSTVS